MSPGALCTCDLDCYWPRAETLGMGGPGVGGAPVCEQVGLRGHQWRWQDGSSRLSWRM